MKIRPAGMLDLLTLCAEARDDEIHQQVALTGLPWDIDAVAVAHYRRPGIKFTLARADDRAVCAGGWDEIAPGVWESWMVGTQAGWAAHWRAITKGSRQIMRQLFECGARRLQVPCLLSRAAACRWHERGLLMERESVMRGYGADGEDVAMFVRLRPGFGE